jgi:protein MAK11
VHTLEHSSRIHDVKFAQRVDGQGEVVLVAAEDKRTTVYEVSSDSGAFVRAIAYLVGHGNRYVHRVSQRCPAQMSYSVKAIDTQKITLPSITRRSTTILSSVSSDGTINVYDLSHLPPRNSSEEIDIVELSPVVTYDSKGSRLTCVTLADDDMGHLGQPGHSKGAKRERESESSEADAEEDVWEGLPEIT